MLGKAHAVYRTGKTTSRALSLSLQRQVTLYLSYSLRLHASLSNPDRTSPYHAWLGPSRHWVAGGPQVLRLPM